MKPRFDILDGMRGSAALFVVIFHLFEANFPDSALNPLHHGYLGVDFFFMLSGFVVGYAYDARWTSWTMRDFFRVRLTRLHPLVLLGIVIGALGYWFDPYVEAAQQVSALRMLLAVLIGILVIPSPALPNRYDETHSLNGPQWTLFQEYLGNILYAYIGPRIHRNGLIITTFLSAVVLIVAAYNVGQLFLGWGASNFWMAPVRMIFPFFCGLLMFRLGDSARINLTAAYPLLTLLLLGVFMMPQFQESSLNGLYEAAAVIVVFPLIVAIGAGSSIRNQTTKKLCDFFGRISYPIYITHYPFIYIYTHWVSAEQPSATQSLTVAAGLLVWFIVLAYVAVRYYDEPVRAWLKRSYEL